MGGEVTAAVNAFGGGSVEPVAPVKGGKASADVLHQVSTSKELKELERIGEHVPLGEAQLIKAIERANKALDGAQTTFEFSIHEKTKQIMVKVMDKEDGTVIREIPPEKTLDLVAKLWELAGILVDERR